METTRRRSMSPQRRLRIFEAHSGKCHLCSREIVAGEAWDVEHVRALALGGEDADANCAPAHRKCHVDKGDGQRIAHAKRQKASSLGIRAKSGFPKPIKAPKPSTKPSLPHRLLYAPQGDDPANCFTRVSDGKYHGETT